MKIKRRFCAVLLAAVLVGVSGAFASAASVEILSPSAGAQLSGSAKVRARVIVQPGEKLDKVVLQTSRGDMLRMAPMFADVFEATLDTTRLRNGRQALVVVASAKGGDEATLHPDEAAWGSMIRNWSAEIPVLISNPYHCYWGDLHAHTNYSDGAGLPADAYQFARDKARLDFFAVTDHSPLLTLDEHSDTVAQAERFNQPGRFVTLWGVEATESWGHINFYMTPSPRLPGNLDLLYRAGGEMMLLGHFNHPSVDPVAGRTWRDDFQGFHHSPAADSAMALVEVRDEREERAYIALLDAGWHVGAAGDQDQHDRKWGLGKTWTVALARELSREAILDALWSRRTYSTADRNLQLNFTVDGEDMGARIARRAGTYTCLVTLQDPDPDHVIDRIDLFLDGRLAATEKPKLAKYAWSVPVDFGPGRHYVFVRVKQPGEKTTWSSPVWVEAY